MKGFLVVLALVAVVFADSCKDNCLSDTCETCYCGTSVSMRDASSVCSKYAGWNIEECICALKVASGGNANAVSFNADGSSGAGLFMIDSALWATCSNGVPPCTPELNLQCAVQLYKQGDNSFTLFPNAMACLPMIATTTSNSSNATTTKHPTNSASTATAAHAAATSTHAAATTHNAATHAAATAHSAATHSAAASTHAASASHAAASHASGPSSSGPSSGPSASGPSSSGPSASHTAATPHSAASSHNSATPHSATSGASSQTSASSQTTYGGGFGEPFRVLGGQGKIASFNKEEKEEVEISKVIIRGSHSLHADEKNVKKFEF